MRNALTVGVLGIVVLFLVSVIVREVSKYRYYVKYQKADDDAFAAAMRKYHKLYLKDALADLKKSWAQCRSKNQTP